MFNRRSIIIRDGWVCQSCGKVTPQQSIQIAHKIHQGVESENYIAGWLQSKGVSWSKTRIREDIINNSLNVCVTCSGYCNDAQNILFNPVECDALLEKIYKSIVLS